MIKRWGLLELILIPLLFFSACAPKATSTEPARSIPKAVVQEEHEKNEWAKVIAEARKEGKVVVYTAAGPQARSALTRAFRDKFGVEIEFITGQSGELFRRILTEEAAGLHVADLCQAGSPTMVTTLKPGNVLQPFRSKLILPEVTDPNAWYRGRIPFVDKDETVLSFVTNPAPGLLINTDMVKPEELQSHRDLLNPKWKGKIVDHDPTISGFGAAYIFVVSEYLGLDYVREFVKQDLLITRDQRLLVDWVARGKYPIGFGALSDIVEEFRKAGSPIRFHQPPEDGGYLTSASGSISFLKNAPHPNAAKLYLNWLLTKEAQTAYVVPAWNQSARVDVTTDHLDPHRIRQKDRKYIDLDSEEYILKKDKQNLLIQEIFMSVIKR